MIPKFPEEWKLTISDLMLELKEGKRKQVGYPELDWARAYERSLIPDYYRFPARGDLYESQLDQEVEFLTAWSAPFTGSGKSTLFKGERIWIDDDPVDEKAIGAYALPVEYLKLESRMVNDSDRNADKYGGFYFHIDTKTLNEKFRLIQTRFRKEKYK